MKRDIATAYISIILFAILVGFSFIGSKISVGASTPLEAVAVRFFVAFICVYILKKFNILKINLSFNDYKSLSLLALFYSVLFFGLQAMGLQFSSSIESGIMFAASPAIITFLAAIFLKEKPSLIQGFSIALSISGVIYIFIMKGFNIKDASTIGLILLFFSSCAQASYNVLARSYKNRFSPYEMSYGMFAVSSIFYLILLVGNHLIKGTLPLIFEPLKNPSFVLSVLYLGIGTTVLSTFFLNRALKSIEAYKTGVFLNVSTVISIFVGIIFLSEPFSMYQAIGSFLIITGVLGANLLGRKKKA